MKNEAVKPVMTTTIPKNWKKKTRSRKKYRSRDVRGIDCVITPLVGMG